MSALVKAAKAEGHLNVITIPLQGWANYGAIMKDFTKKYGIKITDANPNGSSAQEITAIQQGVGRSSRPDVVDVGRATRSRTRSLWSPYKVATWDLIPSSSKDAAGRWYDDYGGYVAIGCNPAKVSPCPTSFAQLKTRRTRTRSGSTATRRRRRRPSTRSTGRRSPTAGRSRHRAGHPLLRQPEQDRQLRAQRQRGDGGRGHHAHPDLVGLPPERDPAAGPGGPPRSRLTGRSRPTTPRRSPTTPRTPRRRACGRSTCTPRRARTCSCRATRGRSSWPA